MYHDHMALRPMFPFYGSKWRARKRYPRPLHHTIIEPFAGSACYSLMYPYHKVELNDSDPVIAGVWDFLIKSTHSDIMGLPEKFEGAVNDLKVSEPAKWLIGFWLVKASPTPATEITGWGKGGKFANQYWGQERRRRVAESVHLLKHWRVTNKSYEEIGNKEGVWFIDPPYQAECGRVYTKNEINFDHLGQWSKGRKGQSIVCENGSADWLPFKPLGHFKTARESASLEVVWTKNSNDSSWVESDIFLKGQMMQQAETLN